MYKPKRANPATHRPITEPPRNATLTVLPISFVRRASLDTRTLEYVAIFIPTKPAAPLIIVPMTKAMAACQLVSTASSMATTVQTCISTLYSMLMNAFAPMRIALATSFILSVPSSIFFTVEKLNAAKAIAKIEARMTKTTIDIFDPP